MVLGVAHRCYGDAEKGQKCRSVAVMHDIFAEIPVICQAAATIDGVLRFFSLVFRSNPQPLIPEMFLAHQSAATLDLLVETNFVQP